MYEHYVLYMYCVKLKIRMFVDIYTERDCTHQNATLHSHDKTWKGTVLEEAGKCGKTWIEVKRLAGNTVRRGYFTNAVF